MCIQMLNKCYHDRRTCVLHLTMIMLLPQCTHCQVVGDKYCQIFTWFTTQRQPELYLWRKWLNVYVYSQTADTNNSEETTDGDDVPLLTGDPEAGDADLRPAQDNNMPVTTRGRSQTMSSDHIGHCSHREHFKFSFNIGLFFSLVFLMLEAISGDS